MKGMLFTNVCAIACAALLVSCASSKVSYMDAQEEMAIVTGPQMELRHYSPGEIAAWNVLVVDTENTRRTVEMLNDMSASMKKARNQSAAQDLDADTALRLQEAGLKSLFGTVVYEQEKGAEYDCIILRDFQVFLASVSGQNTEVTISYYLVYEDDGRYISRGYYTATCSAAMPYPARSYALQEATKGCVDDVGLSMAGGLDMYQAVSQASPKDDAPRIKSEKSN